MLKRFKFNEDKARALVVLDMVIDRSSRDIQRLTYDQPRREKEIEHLSKMIEMRNNLKHDGKMMKGLDPTVVVSGIIGLTGVAMLMAFEKEDIISTKTLGSVTKWFGM